jgi:hypothetical protein
MGSSVAVLMNASFHTENLEIKAARAEVEIEMLQAISPIARLTPA